MQNEILESEDESVASEKTWKKEYEIKNKALIFTKDKTEFKETHNKPKFALPRNLMNTSGQP